MNRSPRAACLALVCASLFACSPTRVGEPDSGPRPVRGNLPATSAGPVDAGLMRDKLAGAWVVQRAGRVVLEWNLDGDSIALTDRRFPVARELRGEFRVRSSSGFGVEVEDGTTYWYSAAWVGSEVHVGLGTVIEAPDPERFTAWLGAWERLERTPDGCVYVRTWGGDETRADVPCEITEHSGRQVFSFEAEDPFRPDRLKRVELDVVGTYLMDRELAESLAVPRVVYERQQEAAKAESTGDAPADEGTAGSGREGVARPDAAPSTERER